MSAKPSEKELLDLKKFMDLEKKHLRKILSEMRRFQEKMKSEMRSAVKKNNETARDILQTIVGHEKQLKEFNKQSQTIDETLCNVLLAIRQNEYLQAWHSPQHGFPEMKITGKHPAKGAKP